MKKILSALLSFIIIISSLSVVTPVIAEGADVSLYSRDIEKERVRYEPFLGGTVYRTSDGNGYYYETNGGLATLTLQSKDYAVSSTVNENEGYIQWNADKNTAVDGKTGNTRLYMNLNFMVASDRDYEIFYDAKNVGTGDFDYGWYQWDVNPADSFATFDGQVLPAPKATQENYQDSYPTWLNYYPELGNVPAGKSETTRIILPNNEIVVSENNPSVPWYFRYGRLQFVNEYPGALIRFYGVGIKETALYHTVDVEIPGGSYKADVKTLNFGIDSVLDETSFTAEDYADITFDLNAPEGSVIKKVEFIYDSGKIEDFSDGITGKSSGKVSIENLTESGKLKIGIISVTSTSPVISELNITGDKEVGGTVYADYKYESSVADASSYQWQRNIGGVWTDIPGATSRSYKIQQSDYKGFIRVLVKPKNENGETWIDVESDVLAVGLDFVYFVSPDGSDENSGTIEKPFATIEKARDTIAGMKEKGQLPNTDITVFIREGDYRLTETLEFTEKDSAPKGCTISYKAYNGEKVRVMGSQNIPSTAISKVTETEVDSFGRNVLESVIDAQARDNIYKIDLSSYKGEFPAFQNTGWSYNNNDGEVLIKDKCAFIPIVVYVNNKALEDARWPNLEQDSSMFIVEGVVGGDTTTATGTAIYPDETGRTKNWNQEAVVQDGRVDCHTGFDWMANRFNLKSFNGENRTYQLSTDGKGYTTHYSPGSDAAYFVNILEEIDMPGESFIDRSRKVVYFYPAGDVSDAEIEIPLMEDYILELSGVSGLTFDGIDFVYGLDTIVKGKEVKDITINNCVVAHSSFDLGNIEGTGIKITNNHIYDSQYMGLTISGGDKVNVVSSGNVIENNVFHGNARLQNAYMPSVNLFDTLGTVIRGNLIYDNPHSLMLFGYGEGCNNSDIIVENNELHHAVFSHGDAGAIYWGSNASSLGVVIRNNYFHHMSGPYYNGWSQSIFCDNASWGAEIYNNIFYQGSLPKSRGGASSSYAFKTLFGQFFNVKNNIFVDVPYAAYYQPYGKYDWITYNNDARYDASTGKWTNHNVGFVNSIGKTCDDPKWKEYFKNTPWEYYFTLFSNEKYKTIQSYRNNNDWEGLKAYIDGWNRETEGFSPEAENTFANNVCISVSTPSGIMDSSYVTTGTNYVLMDTGADYSYMFRNSDGGDYSLSDEGLRAVKAVVPEFNNINTTVIGVKGDVDGYAPEISDAKVSVYDDRLVADYIFDDPDGDKEGQSHFIWYMADSEDGEYRVIKGKGDNELYIDDSFKGKFVKYTVTGIDENNRYGNTVTSRPVLAMEGEAELILPDASSEFVVTYLDKNASGFTANTKGVYGNAPAKVENVTENGNTYVKASVCATNEEALYKAGSASGFTNDEFYLASVITLTPPGNYEKVNSTRKIRIGFDAKAVIEGKDNIVPVIPNCIYALFAGVKMQYWTGVPSDITSLSNGWFSFAFPAVTPVVGSDYLATIGGSPIGRPLRFSNFNSEIADLLIEYGVYCGVGFNADSSVFNSTGSKFTFTVDASNSCKSWTVDKTGTYSIKDNCSSLECVCSESNKSTCPRYLKTREYVERAKNHYLLIDNWRYLTEATVYSNVVKLSGIDSVNLLLNPVSNEIIDSKNRKIIRVNDIFGFTATVDGKIHSASYNGLPVSFVYDETADKTTISVGADSVTQGAVLEIKAGEIKEKFNVGEITLRNTAGTEVLDRIPATAFKAEVEVEKVSGVKNATLVFASYGPGNTLKSIEFKTVTILEGESETYTFDVINTGGDVTHVKAFILSSVKELKPLD